MRARLFERPLMVAVNPLMRLVPAVLLAGGLLATAALATEFSCAVVHPAGDAYVARKVVVVGETSAAYCRAQDRR